LANQERTLMAGTVRRGGQIAWAGLKLGAAVLRLRRRAPERLPAYVSATLVGLGTTFVKLGQGLSLRWDLLPVPYREALARLHSDVPAFPADEARRMVEQAFGAPVDALFASFDDKPLAAASVAQIHPARMQDGRDVVVKITRPGIHAQVQADLRLLRRTMRVAQWIWPPLKRHRPLELVDELGAFLRDEIDMRHEAHNMRRMAKVLDALPGITQPHVVEPYATRDVLVQDRSHGTRLEAAYGTAAAPELARALLDAISSSAPAYSMQIRILETCSSLTTVACACMTSARSVCSTRHRGSRLAAWSRPLRPTTPRVSWMRQSPWASSLRRSSDARMCARST
jgi:ubiquinone biosynthesis protein